MNKTRLLLAVVCAAAFLDFGPCGHAQTIAPAFATDYSFVDLGAAPGVPVNYGGLTLKSGDPNTLLLGGSANGGNGAVYAIGVLRDSNNHITAFSGTATLFSTAPGIDGGLAYGPGGVLFFTGYPSNQLGEIKPGSTVPDKTIDLNALGVVSSVGTVQFVPAGFPDAGGLRIASYNGGGLYSGTLSSDGAGTFNLSGITLRVTTGFGPEGILFVPSGAPAFIGPSMLISEYSANRISAYDLDSNGIPIPASRRDFMTGLSGALGAFTDPLTKDFLFSTFGGSNRVIAVRGFVVPPCTPPPPGMVSWYPLDGTAVDIQSGNNGTPQGNVTFVNGKVNQAASLGGTGNTMGSGDRILVGNPANLRLQDFTIDAWVKRASSTIVTNNGRPGVEGGVFFAYGDRGYGFGIDQATSRLFLTQVEVSAVFSTSTITDTNYHHVAVTKSGGTVTFYIDGVANTPVSYNPTFTFATNAAIGARGDSDVQNAFFGNVDELEIFNRPLTAQEVAAIVNAGISGKCRTCTPPPANMVSWYPGDGNANDIQGGNNGTLQNGATFAPGFVNQAFSFDGVDDQVTVPHNANQNTGSQITIDAWVYPITNAHGRTIFQKRSSGNIGGYVLESTAQPSGADNGLQWVIMIGGVYRFVQTPANVLTLGTWQHVAATYNGAVMKVYVNGVEVASRAQTGAIDPVTDPVVIGRNVANPSIAWHGLLDEIELFNRALSQGEIQAIVNAGNAGKCRTAQCPTIVLSPATLPNGTAGSPYNQTISASGSGNVTYTFAVTNGSLPPGLTLSSSGQITGTPTATGPFNFTVTATDPSNCTGSQGYSITISCPTISVNPASLPAGTVGSAYNQTVSASGGSGSYTFAVTGGSLPTGLTLTSTSGQISGTPTTTSGSPFSFTVTATDASTSCMGSRGYSIAINCPAITLSPSSLPSGTVGASYSQTISASGTAGPYSFSVTTGSLPPGLMLSTAGQLSGTPTQSGSSTFTVTATDATAGCSGSRAYSVTVNPTNDCQVCHKRGQQTLMLPCNSLEFQRHIDHGDTMGACPPPPEPTKNVD